MKEGDVKDLLSDLLKADKLIHEQQLGLNWFPPSQVFVCDVWRAFCPRIQVGNRTPVFCVWCVAGILSS